MKRLLLGLAMSVFAIAANAQTAPEPATIPPVTTPVPKAGLTGAFDWKLRLQPGQKWEVRTFIRMAQAQGAVLEPEVHSANAPGVVVTPTAPKVDVPEATASADALPPPATVPETPASAPEPNTAPTHSEVQLLQRATMDYEVLAIDKFGASTVRLGISELMFDTSTPADVNAIPPVKAEHTNLLLTGFDSVSITVKQAADGTIWNLYGVDTLPQRILKATPNLSAEQQGQAQLFTAQLGLDAYWRNFFRSLSGSLPKYPVIVSESWNYDVSAPSGLAFQMSYHGTRTLKTRSAGMAFIQEDAALDAADFDSNPDKTKLALKYDQGTFNGTSQIDEATGLPVASNMTFKLSGSIAGEVPTQDAQGKKINATFKATGETHTVLERKH